LKIAFDENIPIAMVKAFEVFSKEQALKKLTGDFTIESAETYAPLKQDGDYIAKSDVPWVKRFSDAGGRIIISGDTNMKFKPHERLALIKAGMVVVFFEPKWNNWNFYDKCASIMHWWPVLAKRVKSAEKGTFWQVPLNWKASSGGELLPLVVEPENNLENNKKSKT
jgi:PIN like domain